MMDGTARIMLAEALFPLTALITTGYLTRRLGPEGYGLLALTLTTIIWIESAIVSFFAKATIKFVGESADWRPLGSTIVRLSVLAGSVAMLLLWLLATPIGIFLHEPQLAFYLRIGAIDIPILCVGQAYRSILIGTAQFGGSALARAARWVCRLCIVVLLVEAGFSITGALFGVIGSSFVELAVSRWYLGVKRPATRPRTGLPIRQYGTMLFVSSLCLIAYNGMDLFMLKILGGTAAQSGIYGAAQSLSLLPGLFAWTFSSLLLATLSRLLAEQARERARELARDAMRVTLWLLPVAAIIAGAAPDIVQAVFGSAFVPAAPLLSVLVVGAVANVMLMVGITIMTAAGLPAKTVLFTAPLVPLALVGHLLVIPRWGAQGAALVTLGVSFVGASAGVASVYAMWNVWPPGWTLVRCGVVALAAGAASMLWPTSGMVVFVKLIVLGMTCLLTYWGIGEFRHAETAAVCALLLGKKEPITVT